MASIGARLRELRINKSLTLNEVAEQTGFAISYLSQLERDKVSISVDNLERLAQYYEVHMVHFFRNPEASQVLVTRRSDILKSMNETGAGPAAVTLLANQPNARMEPMLVHISPGKEEPHFRKHEADSLIYILEGQATLISEEGEEIHLQQGDLAYYVNFPHRRVANASATAPLALIAITAPATSSLDDLLQARRGSWVMSDNQ
jgi:transcriptional regulator with XRE-family HTH domain